MELVEVGLLTGTLSFRSFYKRLVGHRRSTVLMLVPPYDCLELLDWSSKASLLEILESIEFLYTNTIRDDSYLLI